MKFIFSCSAAFLSHISREKGKKGKFTCMILIFLPIFASKYFTYLPSEEELKRELNLKEFHKKE